MSALLPEIATPEPAPEPPRAPPTELEALFAPVWAGGWALTRWAWAFAALIGHLPRVWRVEDAYAAPDMVFTIGAWRLAEIVQLTPPTAYVLWAVGLLGIALTAFGGRATRIGLLLWFVGAWTLLAEEALNVKAHDRLCLWVALALAVSPAGERGLASKWRSPAARWLLLIVFCAIYGSTGLMKAMHEPEWFDGQALQYHLVHRYHGSNPLALLVSSQQWLTLGLGWFTLALELAFPFAVWFKRTNPWVLLGAASFHVGIWFLMDVGAFTYVSLAAYPVLLHPEVARGLYERVARIFQGFGWATETTGAARSPTEIAHHP